MPKWAGKWEGGRFYLNEASEPVYFIERRGRSVKLGAIKESLAMGALASYLENPAQFMRARAPEPEADLPVFITAERINLYMQAIRSCVKDHRDARRSYLLAWSEKGLNLADVDKRTLREKLSEWNGGHRGRVEALNAFCNFLVEEEDLKAWRRFVNPIEPKATRAARVIYSLEEIRATYERLGPGPVRDLFYLRAVSGMHQTEIDQCHKVRIYNGPLPDAGTGLRILGGDHVIQGVLQVIHKGRKRHRCSLDKVSLEAALRLREGVPNRVSVWKRLAPMVPSNLRHTFGTLAGEIGEVISYTGGGVPRAVVAQFMGHRAGSTMLVDRYENMPVPPMMRLPLDLGA